MWSKNFTASILKMKENHSGGLAQMRIENKVVPSYAVPEAGERCHVALLDMYFSKLPSEALQMDNFQLPSSITEEARRSKPSLVPVNRH